MITLIKNKIKALSSDALENDFLELHANDYKLPNPSKTAFITSCLLGLEAEFN